MHPLPATALRLDRTEARRLTDEVKRDVAALWRKLLRLHDGGAHTALGYASWGDYCGGEFGMRQSHSYRLLDAGRVVAVIPQLGNEAQARELAPLLRDEGEEALVEVVRRLHERYGELLTSAKIRQAVTERMRLDRSALAFVSSADNEWYTPREIIEAARAVLGGIDLDPASSDEANKTVKAARFYTEQEDGLAREWRGRVWMNPPYGGLQEGFISKLIREREAGHVTAAIVLLNGYRFDARWFEPLWDYPLCFTQRRLNFYNPHRRASSPTTGSVLVYIGRDFDTFVEHFEQFGRILKDPSDREWQKRWSSHPSARETARA